MSTEYPIRFFNVREGRDVKKNQGGGPNDPPSWVLSGKKLKKRRTALCKRFAAVCDAASARFKRNPNLPVVFTAKIGKDAKNRLHSSKTKRQDIAKLFDYDRSPALIGLDGSDKLMVKLVSSEHITEVRRRLRSGADYDYGVSLVEDIEPHHPIIAESIDACARYKLKLLDFQDETANKEARKMVEDLLGTDGARRCDYGSNLTVYAMDGTKAQAICDRLVELGVVLSLTEMPSYTTTLDSTERPSRVTPIPHEPGRTYPRLGILDSGIARCDALAPWIIGHNHPSYAEDYIDRSHGTLVAGTAIYGDRLTGEDWTGVKDGVEVFDATIVPCPGESIYEDELTQNIREALEAHHGEAMVWNLSVSIGREIASDAFSDFAIFLDDMQQKHGIVICKSAGNSTRFAQHEPPDLLNVGAESLLSLVVGSVAHKQGAGDLAKPGRRSPFSCVGPGLEGNVKPDLVHFGGNAGFDADKRITLTGVETVSPTGTVVSAAGTSFATPRVATLAAGLAHELEKSANPLLVKALLIHSARYAERADDANDKEPFCPNEYGFGIPSALPRLLAGNPDETTLVLQQTIPPKHYLEIEDFPMPSTLIDGGLYHFTGGLTLVNSHVLDPSQGLEYCQAHVAAIFGPYDALKEHDTTKRGHPNSRTVSGTHNLCGYDLLSKRRLNASSDHRCERVLIESNMKYCPVKRYYFNTDLMTNANRKFLVADKKWTLQLSAEYREQAQRRVNSGMQPHGLDFCMILTLRDPNRNGRLYNEMVQRLTAQLFSHSALRLRSETEVTVRG